MEHVNDLFLQGKNNFPKGMYLMTLFLNISIFIYLHTTHSKSERIYTQFKL